MSDLVGIVAVLGAGAVLLLITVLETEPAKPEEMDEGCVEDCAPFLAAPQQGECFCNVALVDPSWQPPQAKRQQQGW